MCGEAMEVPEKASYAPPGTEERTFTPGAEMFGLTMPPGPAPREEKDAIALLMSKAPEL